MWKVDRGDSLLPNSDQTKSPIFRGSKQFKSTQESHKYCNDVKTIRETRFRNTMFKPHVDTNGQKLKEFQKLRRQVWTIGTKEFDLWMTINDCEFLLFWCFNFLVIKFESEIETTLEDQSSVINYFRQVLEVLSSCVHWKWFEC